MAIRKLIFFFLVYAMQYPVFAQVSHPRFTYVGKDSVITYASDRYRPNSFLRKILMGKNYRKEWEQPVTLPVFRLSSSKLKIIELGGGMQTKSLKLEDSRGKQWSLRSIDKDVAGALSSSLENTPIQKITQDQISAAFPYGAPVVGALAKSANITAAQPVIYFVADDPAFGAYRHIFAGTVCMLEERDPGFRDTEDTETVLHRVQNTNEYVVAQKVLLRARLLDILVGDWDRHFDNWRWGVRDSAGIRYYHAIPRDRDWAFYYSEGIFPKFVRLAALRFLVNFKEEIKHIKSLTYKTHTLDKVFLNSLTMDDWKEAIHQFQQSISDQDIEDAVKILPPAIYALDGPLFIKKLKSRRDGMEEPVLDYYRFLSKNVQIEGSNEEELFSILPAKSGFLLQIFRLEKGSNKKAQKIFERHFLASETHRVTLNGLGGNDRFAIDETVSSKIRIKLNGGTGNDNYVLAGKVRVKVHDTAAEKNTISNKNSAIVSFR